MASPLETGATLLDLQTELYARGADHLMQDAQGVARGLRWINQAYAEVYRAEAWPFRLNTATGAAPLSIPTLGKVLSVVDTANANYPLTEMTERELTPFDVTLTGTPVYYYRDNLQVKTWPVGGTLSVRFYNLLTLLAAPTDQTLVPVDYMDVIVNGAVRRACLDRNDADGYEMAEAERQRGLALMRDDLLVAPTHIERVAFSDDG